jgi:hypothetical protein
LRERLIKVLTDQADSMASVPTILTALCWLELRNQLDRSASTQAAERTSSEHLEGLRARVAAYRDPVEVIFDSPEAAHALGSFDRAEALALLVGPILLGNLAAQSTFDYHRCARQAVDGFLKVHAKCS